MSSIFDYMTDVQCTTTISISGQVLLLFKYKNLQNNWGDFLNLPTSLQNDFLVLWFEFVKIVQEPPLKHCDLSSASHRHSALLGRFPPSISSKNLGFSPVFTPLPFWKFCLPPPFYWSPLQNANETFKLLLFGCQNGDTIVRMNSY